MALPLRALAVLGLVLVLAGCDALPSWIGGRKEPPLPGKRISVLALEQRLAPDPEVADLEVRLPAPVVNADWPQNGGYPSHAMYHVAAGPRLEVAWTSDVGTSSSAEMRLTAGPVVAQGRVFSVDAEGRVFALDAKNGKLLWRRDLGEEDDDEGGFGGAAAYSRGRLFVATGWGDVVALAAKDGRPIWRRSIGRPVRVAPTVSGGRVFVLTHDNHLFALDGASGEVLWTYAGFAETAALLGGASPAVEGDIVVAAFSSGELVALRAENGRLLWSETLGTLRPVGGLAALNDIRGDPVIDRGMVFAISHGGRLVAIDLRSGSRLWEQAISGVSTPWVAGDFIFVLTNDGDVLCITRKRGQVRWMRRLPRYEDPEDKDEPIFWTGPTLAGDRLLVSGSRGDIVAISPYTGELLGRLDLSDPLRFMPAVAQRTVFVLTDDAELVALR